MQSSSETMVSSAFPLSVDEPDLWDASEMPVELSRQLAVVEAISIKYANTQYEGFGSFHSENVEDVIGMDDKEYRPPSLPSFARRILSSTELQEIRTMGDNEAREEEIMQRPVARCDFGRVFRREHFVVTPKFVFLNHGAFGGALRGALEVKHRFEMMMEHQVVQYMDRILLPLALYSVRRLAEFVNADPKQIVIATNATFMLNSAMELIEKDDVVAYFDTEYLSVYKMMYFRCKKVGASLHEVPLLKYWNNPDIMGDDEALTREMCSNLPGGCTTVVVDHITSTTALLFPVFTHLIPSLKRCGVKKVIVDGAHAPLQVDLDFKALPEECQPSVFVGNLHKWCSLPKSAGFMWVHSTLVDSVHPVVLSHGSGDGLLSEFIWDGTRDHSSYLCIPAVIDFWYAQGHKRVREYCIDLLQQAAVMLSESFDTKLVSRHSPFMSLVELPKVLQTPNVTPRYLQDVLHDVYRVEVPVKKVEGRLYVRISAFVYNERSDYVYLREAVLSMSRKLGSILMRKGVSGKMEETPPDNQKVLSDKHVREKNGCGLCGLNSVSKRRRGSRF